MNWKLGTLLYFYLYDAGQLEISCVWWERGRKSIWVGNPNKCGRVDSHANSPSISFPYCVCLSLSLGPVLHCGWQEWEHFLNLPFVTLPPPYSCRPILLAQVCQLVTWEKIFSRSRYHYFKYHSAASYWSTYWLEHHNGSNSKVEKIKLPYSFH